jgi:hypothetical protein
VREFDDVEPTQPDALQVDPRFETFIVRMSADREHGHVQHVGSRRRAFFSSPNRLMRFIEEQLEAGTGAEADASTDRA